MKENRCPSAWASFGLKQISLIDANSGMDKFYPDKEGCLSVR
jgi:hypothetical protein